MADLTEAQTEALREKVDTLTADDAEAHRDFAMAALEEAADMLRSNRADAKRMGMDEGPEVDDLLTAEHVREIEVRARPYENPRVTVWMRNRTLPAWANTAERRNFYPGDINAYNGKVTATIDVRPF